MDELLLWVGANSLDLPPFDGHFVAISSASSTGIVWETEDWSDIDSRARFPAQIGDINGDGTTDFVSAVMTYRHPERLGPWGLFIFSGKDGRLLFNMPGPDRDHDFFGASVAAIDDLDGDGILEVVVGDARRQSDDGEDLDYPGRAYVYSFGPGSRDEFQITVVDINDKGLSLTWPSLGKARYSIEYKASPTFTIRRRRKLFVLEF